MFKWEDNLGLKLMQRYNDEAKTKISHQYHVDQFGKKQGEYKIWYLNGQIGTIGNYKDIKLHGKHQEWWYNGRRDFIETRHFKKRWHGTKVNFRYENK